MPPASDRSAPDRKTRALVVYLRARLRARDADEMYLKARSAARDLELSPQEIGSLLGQLEDADTDLTVEKWAWSTATTWRISLTE